MRAILRCDRTVQRYPLLSQFPCELLERELVELGIPMLVAKTVSFTSGSYFHTYTAASGGLGSRQAALVE